MNVDIPVDHEISQIFRGEITPCQHLIHIYEDEGTFLNTLVPFVSDGIVAGESVIVIATPDHLEALNGRLVLLGVDLDAAKRSDRYITLDAEAALSRFMVNGMPDEELFGNCTLNLLARARKNGRRVRFFGEMVSVLWAQGRHEATIQLEQIGKRICATEELCILCAYPTASFTQNADASIRDICAAHSRVLAG